MTIDAISYLQNRDVKLLHHSNHLPELERTTECDFRLQKHQIGSPFVEEGSSGRAASFRSPSILSNSSPSSGFFAAPGALVAS